jgi:Flp pilus assembly protein TadD
VAAAKARRALDRAYALADAGEYARALMEAERVVSMKPDLAEAHTQRGWALENLGSMRLFEARQAYETALELDPGDLWAALGLGTVLTRFGELEEAEAQYRKVSTEAPDRLRDEPDLAEALGWAQYRVGMVSAAIATLRRHLGTHPDDVAVRLDLALVMLVAGLRDDALSELREAIDAAGPGTRGHLAVALDDLEAALVERAGLTLFGGKEARAMLASALGRISHGTVTVR